MAGTDLSGVQAAQNEALSTEQQLAQMQMQFEVQLDAAKAEKDAASAIQNNS